MHRRQNNKKSIYLHYLRCCSWGKKRNDTSLYQVSFKTSPSPASQHIQNNCLSFLSLSLTSLSGQMHETLCPPFYRQNRPYHPSPANTCRKTTCLSSLLVSLLSSQMHETLCHPFIDGTDFHTFQPLTTPPPPVGTTSCHSSGVQYRWRGSEL
jgi:hypothetical protein